jgi:uncharacterized protein YcbX
VEVKEATIDAKGIAGDRHFMLMTPLPLPMWKEAFDPDEATHRFLTQRQCPSLATVVAKLEKETLILSCEKLPGKSVTISVEPLADAKLSLATLWDDVVEVKDMGDEVADFIHELVSQDDNMPDEMKAGVRLVVQASSDKRITSVKYTPASAYSLRGSLPSVALTDGFPILVASEASLDELNERMKAKGKPAISMSQFRPNIVVKGAKAFDEDTWKVISIDGVVFHVVKGCPRCKQSCTNQVTGAVSEEPLETLSEFRVFTVKKEDIFFAQNVIPAVGSVGSVIRTGAKIKVLQRGPPVWGSA